MATEKTKHTQEEILNALRIVTDVCRVADDCGECPLRKDYGECMLESERPCDWIINTPHNWRAFG